MERNTEQYLEFLKGVTPNWLQFQDTFSLDRMEQEIAWHISRLPMESPKVDTLLWKRKDVLSELSRRGNA